MTLLRAVVYVGLAVLVMSGLLSLIGPGKDFSGRWPTQLQRWVSYIGLISLALLMAFPLWVTLVNSVSTPAQISSRPPTLFPTSLNFDGYRDALDAGMPDYLLNSAIQTLLIMIGQVFTAVCAGYAFAFLRFPFKRLLFVLFLSTMMIPFEVTVVTNLTTIRSLDLYDTYAGLALPFMATGFGAFMMRQAFLGVPGELRDAATLDGMGNLQFLRVVALPLVRPSVAAMAVFAFLSGWTQYLWPFLATKADGIKTVQVGIKLIRNTQLDKVNGTFAALVLASLPLVIGLIVFQRQLIKGLTAGAVKG